MVARPLAGLLQDRPQLLGILKGPFPPFTHCLHGADQTIAAFTAVAVDPDDVVPHLALQIRNAGVPGR